MDTYYQIDRDWFGTHPTKQVYRRNPLPDEWQESRIPQGAVVTVHRINDRCTVRVLEIPNGPRLATALDADSDPCFQELQ